VKKGKAPWGERKGKVDAKERDKVAKTESLGEKRNKKGSNRRKSLKGASSWGGGRLPKISRRRNVLEKDQVAIGGGGKREEFKKIERERRPKGTKGGDLSPIQKQTRKETMRGLQLIGDKGRGRSPGGGQSKRIPMQSKKTKKKRRVGGWLICS